MVSSAARIIVASSSILMATSAVAVPPAYTFQAGIGSEEFDDDPESFYYLAGSALFSRVLSRHSIVDLQAEISSKQFSDDDLSEDEIFLQGTYSYTPRAGFRVPTYGAGLRLEEEFASDDDLDTTKVTLLLSLSYRLNDRTSVVGGLKFSQEDNDVRESDIYGVFFNLDYQYTPQLILYTTLDLENEEIDAEAGARANAARNAASGIRKRTHNEPDPGSGDPVDDDLDNTYLTIGANYKLDAFNSLDVSIRRDEFEGSTGTVTSNVYSIDYFHRF